MNGGNHRIGPNAGLEKSLERRLDFPSRFDLNTDGSLNYGVTMPSLAFD